MIVQVVRGPYCHIVCGNDPATVVDGKVPTIRYWTGYGHNSGYAFCISSIAAGIGPAKAATIAQAGNVNAIDINLVMRNNIIERCVHISCRRPWEFNELWSDHDKAEYLSANGERFRKAAVVNFFRNAPR